MIKKLLFLLISASSLTCFSQGAILSNTAPTTGAVGESIITTFNYTASVAGTCQVQLFKTDASGNINYSAGTDMFFTGPVTAAATSTVKSITFVVSNTVTPTSTLPAGQVYKWFFKLTVGGVDYYGSNLTTTITNSVFAVDSFQNTNVNEFFVNSFNKSLNVNIELLTSFSANIFDINGRNIASINDLKIQKTFDLSNLDKGIYFLITNDNKKLKFVL